MGKNKSCTKDSKEKLQLKEWTGLLFVEGRESFLHETSYLSIVEFMFMLNDMRYLVAEEVNILAMMKKQEADDG